MVYIPVANTYNGAGVRFKLHFIQTHTRFCQVCEILYVIAMIIFILIHCFPDQFFIQQVRYISFFLYRVGMMYTYFTIFIPVYHPARCNVYTVRTNAQAHQRPRFHYRQISTERSCSGQNRNITWVFVQAC